MTYLNSILLGALLIGVPLGCKNKGTKEDSVQGPDTLDSTPVSVSGEVLFSFPGELVSSSIEFRHLSKSPFKVGSKNKKVEVDAPDRIQIRLRSIPSGTHQMIVRGETTAGEKRAKLFSGIQVTANKVTAVTVDKLLEASSLTGEVSLQDGKSPAGVEVLIQDTDYKATTDANGRFSIDHVPLMPVTVVALASGYWGGRMEKVELTSSAAQSIGILRLLPVSYANGTLFVDQITPLGMGDDNNPKSSVSFILVAPKTADSMRIGRSEEERQNAPWSPLSTNLQMDYSQAGKVFLYVDFGQGGTIVQSVNVSFDIQVQ